MGLFSALCLQGPVARELRAGGVSLHRGHGRGVSARTVLAAGVLFAAMQPGQGAWGQGVIPGVGAASGAGAVAQNTLLIGPGDELHVQVFDTPNMDETARVGDDGRMPLLMGGTIQVNGQTPDGAARAVEAALVRSQVMYHPRVLVTVTGYSTQNVTVYGQVVRAGAYPINTPRMVIDVLALAGGLTDAADRHVTVERHGTGEKIQVFVSNQADTALANSVTVYPGDRVVVPRAPVIYVLGDVIRAGGFATTSNDSRLTVLQVVSLAGGTATSAVPNDTRLIRRTPDGGYTTTRLKLSDMQKGKAPDVALMADDILYVPFSYLRNAVALGVPGIAASATSALIYTH